MTFTFSTSKLISTLPLMLQHLQCDFVLFVVCFHSVDAVLDESNISALYKKQKLFQVQRLLLSSQQGSPYSYHQVCFQSEQLLIVTDQ